jgi:Flp pilus assembly protein TadB
MSEAGREHQQNQPGLAAVYHYAATLYDQAAQMYEELAKYYDQHDQAARAEHERRMAAHERPSTGADRERAPRIGGVPKAQGDQHATLPPKIGDDTGNSPGKSSRLNSLESYRADLAALLGATITVVLTLTFSPGAWGPLSTIIGSLLLVILLAFFWGRRPLAEQSKQWEFISIGLSLSVVIGLIGAITLAQAIQWRWFRDDTGRTDCRSVAVAQATAAVHDLSHDLSNTYTSAGTLQRLVNDALRHGSTERPDAIDTPLSHTFYNAYGEAVGDCRAGDTFEKLWWIGIPSGLLTLAWWNWEYIKRFPKQLGQINRHVVGRLRKIWVTTPLDD